MERHAMHYLDTWRSRRGHLPLVLRGARQVGKTWLMREFGKLRYAKTAYVNFEGNERMQQLFGMDYNIPRILAGLRIETGIDIRAEDTLLVFDEVQEVPRALTSLKYFQ
ncbi:MAG: AAA family ATPase, partial [Clostridiaceae bacterium]|nr:AAA family ATPase [Clostridiaceae bacterium]